MSATDWYVIVELQNGLALFEMSEPGFLDIAGFLDIGGDRIAPFKRVHSNFYDQLQRGATKLIFAAPNRQEMDEFVKEIIVKRRDGILLIADISRTELPQLGGEAAMEAFVMGYLLGSDRYDAHNIDFDAKQVLVDVHFNNEKIYVSFSKIYRDIRNQYPLIIMWQDSVRFPGGFKFHPDYEPVMGNR